MKQRKPFRISRNKVTSCFGGFGIELFPSEIQRRTKLSRPTVFNVLKYYKEKGILNQKGKKYSLSPSIFKTRGKCKEPLKDSWLMRYEYLLQEWAKKNQTTVEEMPELIKEFIEAHIRKTQHFAKLDGLNKSIKKLPGWKSQIKTNMDLPISFDINTWEKEQKTLLRELKKHRRNKHGSLECSDESEFSSK
jgi:hypothetical protein